MITMMGFNPPVSKLYYHWDVGMEKHGDKYITVSNPVDYTKLDHADCYYQTNLLKPKHHSKDRSDTQGNHYQYILEFNFFKHFNNFL